MSTSTLLNSSMSKIRDHFSRFQHIRVSILFYSHDHLMWNLNPAEPFDTNVNSGDSGRNVSIIMDNVSINSMNNIKLKLGCVETEKNDL